VRRWAQRRIERPADGSAGLPSCLLHPRARCTSADSQRQQIAGALRNPHEQTRGLQVMNAIAVAPDVPLWECAVRSMVAPAPSKATQEDLAARRGARDCVLAPGDGASAFGARGSQARPWFQLDRAGDSWSVLLSAHSSDSWLTVRSRFNRRVETAKEEPQIYLWQQLARQAPMASFDLVIQGSSSRKRALRDGPAIVRGDARPGDLAVAPTAADASVGRALPLKWAPILVEKIL